MQIIWCLSISTSSPSWLKGKWCLKITDILSSCRYQHDDGDNYDDNDDDDDDDDDDDGDDDDNDDATLLVMVAAAAVKAPITKTITIWNGSMSSKYILCGTEW